MDSDPKNNLKYLLEYQTLKKDVEMLEFYKFNEVMKYFNGIARIMVYETSGKKN